MTPVQKKNRLIILLVAGIFFLPVIASVVLNSNLVSFSPTPQTNRGELIQPPVALSPPQLVSIEGRQLQLDRFDGRWTVILLAQGGCDSRCGEAIDGLLRTDLALNVRADQVDYVVVDLDSRLSHDDHPAFARDDLFAAHLSDNQALFSALGEAGVASHEPGQQFIINAGYLMMQYQTDQSGADVLRDLQRLTRARGRDAG